MDVCCPIGDGPMEDESAEQLSKSGMEDAGKAGYMPNTETPEVEIEQRAKSDRPMPIVKDAIYDNDEVISSNETNDLGQTDLPIPGRTPPSIARSYSLAKIFKENLDSLFGPKPQKRKVTQPSSTLMALYCQHVSETDRMGEAAALLDVSPETINNWRHQFPEFEQAVLFAKELYRDTLLGEAHHRATVGDRDVFYKDGKIDRIIIKKSDRLLELLLKKHDPQMRDGPQTQIQVGGVLVVPQAAQSTDDWIRSIDGPPLDLPGAVPPPAGPAKAAIPAPPANSDQHGK